MKTGINFLALIVLSLLISVTQAELVEPHQMDMTQALENAKTAADHEALAKHYEEVAKSMQLKAQEHEKLLEKYETNTHLYGRMGERMQAHCKMLIRSYEDAAKANMEMAESHRSMAAEMK
jgi:D-ribose pyranose/furanose isomerase RbsD